MTAEEDVVRQIVQQMSEVVVLQWVGFSFLPSGYNKIDMVKVTSEN